MKDVYVLGTATLRFGKHPERSYRDMTAEALRLVLADAKVQKRDLEYVFFANSGWGRREGQDCIRGQVALRQEGLGGIPIMNVENACAGGSSALHGAALAIASGDYDCALAIGVEKIFHPDKLRMFTAFLGGLDVGAMDQMMADWQAKAAEIGISGDFPADVPAKTSSKTSPRPDLLHQLRDGVRYAQDIVVLADLYGWNRLNRWRKEMKGGSDRSPVMDAYSLAARHHMKHYGSTIEQLATIAAKNHNHGALNPDAQYRFPMTVEAVLEDRRLSYPLTRAMCAPIGDGAAAVIVCSKSFLARQTSARPVAIRASVLGSGVDADLNSANGIGARVARAAYEQAGLGPADIDFAELHDATAYGELHNCEALGFCNEGEGGVYAQSGATALGGARPVNTSGGLECRGHPIGATGLAQVHEITTQLRHAAGPRQVPGARIGLAQNGGGVLGAEEAAMCVHILEKCA